MGRCIVQLADNEYVEWSSVVDAPISYVMDKTETYDYMWDEARDPLDDSRIRARIKRLESKGTTSMLDPSDSDVLRFNRAGPNEETLTRDAIRRRYKDEDAYNAYIPLTDDIIPDEFD